MNKGLSALSLLTLVVPVFGCAPPELEVGGAESVEGDLIRPVAGRISYWQNGAVNVCIVKGSGSPQADFDEARTQAMIALENSWGREANLFFDFRCRSTTTRATLTLAAINHLGGGGAADLGASANAKAIVEFCAPSLPGADCNNQRAKDGSMHRIDRNEKLRATVMHEFGHILGFVHEHKRADVPADVRAWCEALTPENLKNGNNEPEPQGGDTLSTSYDPDSILQYCKDVDRNRRGDELWEHVSDRLSEGDRQGVRRAYGAPVPLQLWKNGLYRVGSEPEVYHYRSGKACQVTWAQFIDIGRPMVTSLNATQGVEFKRTRTGQLCSKETVGALPEDVYRITGRPEVYRLTGQVACHVSQALYQLLGRPDVQVLTAADGARFLEAYGPPSLCR